MSSERISVEIDPEDLVRLDRWRMEVEPADDRETAAANLVFIGLDEVEGKNSHAGVEVTDTLALGISAAMALEEDAKRQGQSSFAAQAHRIHEMFQEIATYLNTDAGEMAESVIDRLDALDEAPTRKQ